MPNQMIVHYFRECCTTRIIPPYSMGGGDNPCNYIKIIFSPIFSKLIARNMETKITKNARDSKMTTKGREGF